jgi:hypothetical protein
LDVVHWPLKMRVWLLLSIGKWGISVNKVLPYGDGLAREASLDNPDRE